MTYPRPRSTPRVPTRCRLRDALKAALILATSVSCAPEQADESLVRLSPVASIPAPLSTNTEITLVDEDTACVINSYEVRVRCSDRAGSVVGAFGREGEGPGEFQRLGSLERGPDGTIGVFDMRAGRMTVFRPDGVRLSETPVPRLFSPAAPFGSVINGYYLALPSDTVVGLAVLADVDVASGEVLWARDGLDDLIESECGRVVPGRPIPGGGYVFRSCQSELVFIDDRDDVHGTAITPPTYVAELPNERDVDDYGEGISSIGRRSGMSLPKSALEPYLAGFRETPKGWFPAGDPLVYDDQERLWAATTRDRDRFSYLDVYEGTEYMGTVRVRDRLVGYDILGGTLAVLVDRQPGVDGIARRAIDWYRIDEVMFGGP